jgi:hypothetical protein
MGSRYAQALFVLGADSGELLAARVVESAECGDPRVQDLLAD